MKNPAVTPPSIYAGKGPLVAILVSVVLASAGFLSRAHAWSTRDTVVLIAYLAVLSVAIFAKPIYAR